MRTVKLNEDQYQRSLKSRDMDHLWVYNKNVNSKKIHNFGTSLSKWNGAPQLCIVIDNNENISDDDLSKIFGKGSFINGAVSPDDKEQMAFETYYISNN